MRLSKVWTVIYYAFCCWYTVADTGRICHRAARLRHGKKTYRIPVPQSCLTLHNAGCDVLRYVIDWIDNWLGNVAVRYRNLRLDDKEMPCIDSIDHGDHSCASQD
jgi:hypothetical protein